MKRFLIIEPYLNDSHQCLAQGLMRHIPGVWSLLSLPGRFFRWRMRGAASYLAVERRSVLSEPWDGIVVSSMLNLAELKGLAPGLSRVPALVYFHENQLDYPAPGKAGQRQLDRDLFLAFTNLTSAQAAKTIAFNSQYQRSGFLRAGRELLARLPDAVPKGLMQAIEAKSMVLPVPLEVREASGLGREPRRGPLRILWNHRWEHDKDPDSFFSALFRLREQGVPFQAAVLGRRPAKRPKCFDRARRELGGCLAQWGKVEARVDYWRWLFWADVAVSAAKQENQGLAVAEAVWAGCRPLVPDALVYPELYPEEHRYPPGGLYNALKRLAEEPGLARQGGYSQLAQGMSWQALERKWLAAMEELAV